MVVDDQYHMLSQCVMLRACQVVMICARHTFGWWCQQPAREDVREGRLTHEGDVHLSSLAGCELDDVQLIRADERV